VERSAHVLGNEHGGAAGEETLQGPGPRGPKVEAERGNRYAATSPDEFALEGSHDSTRGSRPAGNAGPTAGCTALDKYL
jgi:hypothetical protein